MATKSTDDLIKQAHDEAAVHFALPQSWEEESTNTEKAQLFTDLADALVASQKRVEELERLQPLLDYLHKYDTEAERWGREKPPVEWAQKLQDEVEEAIGVIAGTHSDDLLHELLQVASIAFHFYELRSTVEKEGE